MPWIIKLENKYPFHPSHLQSVESIRWSFSPWTELFLPNGKLLWSMYCHFFFFFSLVLYLNLANSKNTPPWIFCVLTCSTGVFYKPLIYLKSISVLNILILEKVASFFFQVVKQRNKQVICQETFHLVLRITLIWFLRIFQFI